MIQISNVKRTTRNLVSVFMALVLAVGMTPIPAHASELQAQTVRFVHPPKDETKTTIATKDQRIEVDGVVVYANNESAEIKNVNGVSYDAATNTLTLSNLNVKIDKNREGNYINIVGLDDVNIHLVGINTITAPKNNKNKKVAFFVGATGNVNVSGGTLKAVNCNGITSGGNINLNSGIINCSKVSFAGLSADGVLTINKKASVSITVNKVNDNAILADKCVNSYKSIKKIDGEVPCGTEFPSMSYWKTKVNSIWRVSDTNSRDITLVKFHELPDDNYFKAYDIALQNSYYDYNLVGIESNAFNTKEGRKLKYMYLGPSLKMIKPNAFKNMKGLNELGLEFKSILKTTKKNGKTKIQLASGVSKKAFANIAKSKIPEVSIDSPKVKKTKTNLKKIKKLMSKCGLKAKWWYYGSDYDYGIKG